MQILGIFAVTMFCTVIIALSIEDSTHIKPSPFHTENDTRIHAFESDSNLVYAHLNAPGGNITLLQEWTSQKDNVRIMFTYDPEKPIIDTFTELKFSVTDLTSGEHIENFLARVVVTMGQRLFQFENISVADGDFSVKYIFPEDGTHQVITRISKNTSIQALASFNVFVPHQAPLSLLNPFPNISTETLDLIARIFTVVVSFSVILVVIIMLKKGKRRRKRRKERAS
jgi:hypothetical protein